MRGFRTFLLRGNVIDMAVGIVIGVVFSAFVSDFVKAFLTPLVGEATGSVGDFSNRGVTIGKVLFPYGGFINGALALVLTAAVLYYIVVLPTNRLTARFEPHTDEVAPKRDCPECLSSIPVQARRCAFCTAALPAVQPEPTDGTSDPRSGTGTR